MRKISFGSFPLTEIRADDRKCLDRYLIKTFSDNISISDAVRNLAITKNMMYITPDTIMRDWLSKDNGNNRGHDRVQVSDRTSNNLYEQALRRAFYILKEFYKKIKNAPFYKEYIYYPIYVEKVEKVDVANKSKDATEVQMNYSFVILSNDLTKGLKIDEIKYDENASLNFLFLFIEFFASEDFGGSIHDFSQKDYEFLVKLYQFVEESGKDPIHMTIDLYKLLGLIKKAVDGDKQSGYAINKTVNSMDNKLLIKYRGMLRHKILSIKAADRDASKNKIYRDSFMDLMTSIFKSEGLSGLFSGVDSSADLNERLQYVYRSNKYREILNLAKELVDYNKLDCKNVISKDPMDFDFSVENNQYSINTQRHVLAQKYQTFFKLYVESIRNYLEGAVKTIIDDLGISQAIKDESNIKASNFDADYATSRNTYNFYKKELEKEEQKFERANELRELIENRPNPNMAQINLYRQDANEAQQKAALASAAVAKYEAQMEQLDTMRKLYKNYGDKIEKSVNSQSSNLYKEVSEAIVSSLANDLTFVYDDGKSFFTDDLIAEGFLKFMNSSKDITELDGFNDIYKNQAAYPEKIDKDGFQSPNPEYYAAQIVRSLHNAFDVMAEDTLEAISDNLRPAIQRAIQQLNPDADYQVFTRDLLERLFGSMEEKQGVWVFKGLDKKSFTDTLRENVYKARFLKHVLKKFKDYFHMHKITKRIDYDENVSQLHPMIAKLVRQGRRCQYFKSFIINYDTCEQLYRLKYILDTQKFLAGVLNQPPRKFNNPMNKLQTVLYDYLGLKDNPVWIISRQNVYLSMPDDLSLTNTSLLSKIPKTELKEVCKIKGSDYWNENTLGRVSKFGSKELEKLRKRIKDKREEITALQKKLKETSEDKAKKTLRTKIEANNKTIDKLEDEYNKKAQEVKNYKPNAFLFNDDDPNKAENEELLSKTELDDLNRRKDDMEKRLLNLNPYDSSEFEELKKQQEKIERSHPMDFEEPEPAEPEDEKKKESELELLLRLRDEAEKERERQGR